MPQYFFKNSFGNRIRIFPLTLCRTIPGMIICEDQNAEQISIHQDCIETVHSDEEILEGKRRFLENKKTQFDI